MSANLCGTDSPELLACLVEPVQCSEVLELGEVNDLAGGGQRRDDHAVPPGEIDAIGTLHHPQRVGRALSGHIGCAFAGTLICHAGWPFTVTVRT
jgi:hypothetical protein